MKTKYLTWICAPAFALALAACDTEQSEQPGGAPPDQSAMAPSTAPSDSAPGSMSQGQESATPAPGVGGGTSSGSGSDQGAAGGTD